MAIIAISRGTFSGGKELAETVAQKLGYKCISREEVIKCAAEFDIPEGTFTDILLKPKSYWKRFELVKKCYLTCVKSSILEQAINSNLVYHGHAGHLLFQEHYWTFKIKIIAPMEYRIEQAMIKQNLSKADATQYVLNIDASRKKWTKFLYGIDWNDPAIFDFVLNLKVMDVEAASEAIVTLTRREPFKPSEISDKIIRRLYFISKVEMALLKQEEIKNLNIKVECREDGVIELKGKLNKEKWCPLLKEVIKKIDSVKEVSCELKTIMV